MSEPVPPTRRSSTDICCGIRSYFMYHHPLLSFILFTSLFFGAELLSAMTLWAAITLYTSAFASQPSLAVEENYVSIDAESAKRRRLAASRVSSEATLSPPDSHAGLGSDEQTSDEEMRRQASAASLAARDATERAERRRAEARRDAREGRRMSGVDAPTGTEPGGVGLGADLEERARLLGLDTLGPAPGAGGRRVLGRLDEETEEDTDVGSRTQDEEEYDQQEAAMAGEEQGWEDLGPEERTLRMRKGPGAGSRQSTVGGVSARRFVLSFRASVIKAALLFAHQPTLPFPPSLPPHALRPCDPWGPSAQVHPAQVHPLQPIRPQRVAQAPRQPVPRLRKVTSTAMLTLMCALEKNPQGRDARRSSGPIRALRLLLRLCLALVPVRVRVVRVLEWGRAAHRGTERQRETGRAGRKKTVQALMRVWNERATVQTRRARNERADKKGRIVGVRLCPSAVLWWIVSRFAVLIYLRLYILLWRTFVSVVAYFGSRKSANVGQSHRRSADGRRSDGTYWRLLCSFHWISPHPFPGNTKMLFQTTNEQGSIPHARCWGALIHLHPLRDGFHPHQRASIIPHARFPFFPPSTQCSKPSFIEAM